jgi:type II secretory pathway pseudopilin PulG
MGAAVTRGLDMHTAPRHEGFTLLETVFALSMLLIVAAGIMPLGLMAVKTTENQGHLAARTTEYAQDKLEQLMALSYGDSTTDTRVFPSADVGGTGLTIGGSSNPDAPANNYVDYLDINGTLIPAGVGGAPAGWYYRRVWQISIPAGKANLKQIAVSATVRVASQGGVGDVPRSTVVALKTNPF